MRDGITTNPKATVRDLPRIFPANRDLLKEGDCSLRANDPLKGKGGEIVVHALHRKQQWLEFGLVKPARVEQLRMSRQGWATLTIAGVGRKFEQVDLPF